MATQKKQAKNKQVTNKDMNEEKKLDIIIQEKKDAPKMNWTFKKALPALFILLIISWIIFTNYNDSIIGKTLPNDANPAVNDGLNAQDQNAPQQEVNDITNQFPTNKDVAEVVDGKQNCTIAEANELIKNNLETEMSAVYIVSYIQNFETDSYVKTYKEETCKIYAPTKQQFQSFLRNRKYYDFTLTNSTVFVDYGMQVKSEQEYYDLIMSAKISKLILKLADVPTAGTSPKYYYNVSDIQKQST